MSVRSAWLLPGGTEPGQTREDTRLSPLGTMTPAGPLTTRPGVIPGGAPFAASGAGAMSLQVGTGRAVAQGTTAQGAYPVAVDAPVVVDFDAGDALHDRIDTVAVRVLDGLYDVSEQTAAVVEVVKGEAAATPAPATLGPACVPLWDVTVPAGASAGVGGIDWGSALTDRRRYTVSAGGIVPRGALGDAGTYDGQYADVGGILYRWSTSAGAWQVYRAPEETVPWITASLASAYSHNGNALGSVRYRRITVAGIPHMQWRGGVSWTTSGTLPANGEILSAVLPGAYRPAVLKSVPISAGGVPIKLDFQTGGVVRLIASSSSAVTTWASLDGALYPLDS
ncbi:hypothetical protein OG909_12270 [Streptomyces sp. NBC_01754]|uniref:hypothetical protein n=1 Tax=Streptomyces sp. NBC_01754 TaxID=2975930 RepID=UPI002DD7D907|nr:hypothetical protein [Streptomyces sp. NBC_01754]WSC93010.1 hypothetical protein OG909_12270 [Streptomyces sp. NBC_01754]